MELGFHEIIKGFVLTTKSTDLFKKQGKVVLHVHCASNKNMIRHAVEKVWDVKVDNVRVINILGKRRKFGGKIFKLSNRKKAIITLKKGYKIEYPGQFESSGGSVGIYGDESKEK